MNAPHRQAAHASEQEPLDSIKKGAVHGRIQ